VSKCQCARYRHAHQSALGLKAVTLIKDSKDPLNAFVQLSQDLPKYAAALARNVGVPEDILQTARRLSVQHPFGPSFLINGRMMKDTELNAFG
jgi:UDP-glucose:glycoprotein glucosyltransferase